MRMSWRGLAAAAVAGVMVNGAGAQTADAPLPPAERPPEDFTGSQYIDSRGCAFIRVDFGTRIDWVPRVSARREQLCEFVPSLGAQARNAANPAADDAPAPVCTGATEAVPGPVIRGARGDPQPHALSALTPRRSPATTASPRR